MSDVVIYIFIGGFLLILISVIIHMKEDINRMNITLNNIAKQIGASDKMNEELKSIILKLISEGKKVKAIKKYRLATGVGLLEAKEYVDSLS